MNKPCLTIEDFNLTKNDSVREKCNHKIYLRTIDNKISLDTPIYRYMKLDYVIDMIENNRLIVPMRSSFTDLYDKVGAIETNRLYRRKINQVPSYKDRQRINRENKKAYSTCVLCWTMDRRENESSDESYLMWKAYSNNSITCRIETTVRKLIDSIKKIPYDMLISEVYYGKKCDNRYEEKLFCKLQNYKDEQEVRLLVLCNRKEHLSLDIDPIVLLTEIIVSPFISKNLRNIIIKDLQERCSGFNVRVRPSSIKEN